jgi:hypothetical protein
MPLLLLCLGTILASSCPASYQPSSSPPPLSGSVVAVWFHLFTRFTTAPTLSCAVVLHHLSRDSRRGHHCQQPQGLHGSGRRAWQPASPGSRPGSLAATKWVSFQTLWFLRLLLWNRFPTQLGGFCMPGTGFTASTDAVPVPSMGTAQEVRPLTSSRSSWGQSSGGALWRAIYTPGDHQTSRVYSTTLVQYLYISCYLFSNKPVLLYLLLRLLPQCCVHSVCLQLIMFTLYTSDQV